MVSTSAVTLKEKQEINKALDRKINVLEAAGLIEADADVSPEEIAELFSTFDPSSVRRVWPMGSRKSRAATPTPTTSSKAQKDPATELREADPNPSLIKRLPQKVVVYKVLDSGGRSSRPWCCRSRDTVCGGPSTAILARRRRHEHSGWALVLRAQGDARPRRRGRESRDGRVCGPAGGSSMTDWTDRR